MVPNFGGGKTDPVVRGGIYPLEDALEDRVGLLPLRGSAVLGAVSHGGSLSVGGPQVTVAPVDGLSASVDQPVNPAHEWAS